MLNLINICIVNISFELDLHFKSVEMDSDDDVRSLVSYNIIS